MNNALKTAAMAMGARSEIQFRLPRWKPLSRNALDPNTSAMQTFSLRTSRKHARKEEWWNRLDSIGTRYSPFWLNWRRQGRKRLRFRKGLSLRV